MKFYMTPGSCSTGIHILLEELELIFEVCIVNLLAGDHNAPDFLAVNPKGGIPVLVLDGGGALTEFQAIAYWLARRYPKAQLLPGEADADSRAMELMDYAVGTMHGQGYARIFTTDKFTPNPADYEAVKAQGLGIVEKGFAILDKSLPEQGYALGKFSIADAALFYIEFWADKTAMPLPVNCRRHYELMLSRPVVRRVLMEEGYRV
ncbi:MAG: glutathione S-transferase N-terminal domain-containing protein [Methylomonas sp.]